MLLNLSRVALLGLALLGGYALHIFSETNGMFPMIKAAQKRGKFPDGPIYQPVITGVQGLDDIINLLLQFFWPAVDGKHIDAALAGLLLGTQGTAPFTLMVLEGLRHGNRGRIMSFTMTTGMLIQLLGFGLIAPIFLLINLITVPPGPRVDAKLISAPVSFLNAIPASQIFGYVLPSIVMALPSPDILSTTQKITAILFWQFFPVWTSVIGGVLGRANASDKNLTISNIRTLDALRDVYRFALYVAAGGHLLVLAFSLTAYFRPDVVGETAAGYLQPSYFYIPQNPFSQEIKISSIAEGAFWFLQWDNITSSVAFWIWGFCVKYLTVTEVSPVSVLWDVIVRPVVLGPAAAALMMVWDRDELVLKGDERLIIKKTK